MSKDELRDIISEQIPISIDLGELELSLSDLLGLRAGMSFSLQKPQIFQATLRIGSNAWADAELTIENEKIRVQIKELIPLKKLFRADSE